MAQQDIVIAKLRLDGGTQAREEIDRNTVADYAELFKLQIELPPPVVFIDGAALWLADGFHRVHAARAAGKAKIRCDVRNGTLRDAILYAAGSNSHHGLRRSAADKRKAVRMLLADQEWSAKSDNWIADTAVVSRALVADVRKEIETPPPEQIVGRDGKKQPSKKPRQVVEQQPEPDQDAEAEPETPESSGPCPHGGEHEFSEGVCNLCFEPEFDGEPETEEEPEKPAQKRDVKAKMAEHNAKCDEFIRAVRACVDVLPTSGWVNEEIRNSAKASLARSTNAVRQQRAYAVCPRCDGERCGSCRQTGFLPKHKWDSLPPHERGEA